MRTFKFLIINTLFLMFIFSCNEDVLNIKPDTKLDAADIFKNENYARANLAYVYSRMPFQEFSLSTGSRLSDEETRSNGSPFGWQGGEGCWNYQLMRDMNVFIDNMQKSEFSDAIKSQMIGEMRVLRAYIYFQMEERWGGVPLVDVVIDPYVVIDEKYEKRSTEEAIADFIDTELTAAASMLSDNPDPKGMVNKWTAIALKARANLWAASIAKYGTVQLNGLLGIPPSRANEFFTKASEAANMVIQSGKYSLYNKQSDKAENYREIFLDEDNSEVIFEKVFDGINIGHDFDAFVQINHLAARGGVLNPLLEFILGYENVDGSTDQPQFGIDHLYNDGMEPFMKKDPRLFGSVFFEGESWAGSTVQTYEGTDTNALPDPSNILINVRSFYKGRREAGLDSRNGDTPQEATKSGFIQKKYIQEKAFVPEGQSSTNWIIFRLAEMYLIRAEAEFELGNMQTAADALNPTRLRAGIYPVDANTITLSKVRTERRSEMAFEQLRYWDLRRWHIAESVLSGFVHGLRIIYHEPTDKYYFVEMEAESLTRDFSTKNYYNAITQRRIDKNIFLVENPGYN